MSADDTSSKAPFNNPFGALQAKRDQLPEGPKPSEKKKAPERGPARAVVRMERKGRGGKEVTVVEQLELPAAALLTWLGDLKRSLGCGGTVQGKDLILQGDQRERIEALLKKKGVRQVSVG